MHSLLLARGDNIILDAYWAPFKKDTLHRMNSVTKSFVALAVGCLIYEGRLSLSDKVIDFFPEASNFKVNENQANLTVENLLTMRTGYRPVGNGHWVRDRNYGRIKNFFEREPQAAIDEEFYYDSTGSYILGVIVERLTGGSFVKYLQGKILNEIGFSSGACCISTPEGYSWSDSGLLCTTEDLYKVAGFINRRGETVGARCIGEDYISRAVSAIVSTENTGKKYKSYGYGYQIWRAPHGGFMFLGMGMQVLLYLPHKDLYIVCTADTQPDERYRERSFELFDELIEGVKDGALPQDDLAFTELCEYVSDLKLTALDIGEEPSENTAFGVEYVAEDNPMGINRFTVRGDGTRGVFSYENCQGDKEIVFGLGYNELSEFPEDGYFDMQVGVSPEGHRYPIAASAGYLADGTLVINVQFVGRHLGGVKICLTPCEDSVRLTMKKSTNCFLDRYNGEAVAHRAIKK